MAVYKLSPGAVRALGRIREQRASDRRHHQTILRSDPLADSRSQPMSWTEATTDILVEASSGTYRLWDIDHAIPEPSARDVRAQIFLTSGWEDLFFNGVWGISHDPVRRKGTWLKQKSQNIFTADLGCHEYRIRYSIQTADL